MKTFTSPAAVTPRFPMRKAARLAITMTLYNLMAALQTQVGPKHEHVITAIVVHLLRTGLIIFSRNPKAQVIV